MISYFREGKTRTWVFFPLAAFEFFRIRFSLTLPCSYFYFRTRKRVSKKKAPALTSAMH